MPVPEPTETTTEYAVTCFPGAGPRDGNWVIRVRLRGENENGEEQWAVTHDFFELAADGSWHYRQEWRHGPEEADEYPAWLAARDHWMATHRFDRQTARRLAKEAAPHLTCNGRTVTEALARAEARAAG